MHLTPRLVAHVTYVVPLEVRVDDVPVLEIFSDYI